MKNNKIIPRYVTLPYVCLIICNIFICGGLIATNIASKVISFTLGIAWIVVYVIGSLIEGGGKCEVVDFKKKGEGYNCKQMGGDCNKQYFNSPEYKPAKIKCGETGWVGSGR